MLPSHFLEKIDPADRMAMGKAGLTPADVQSKADRKAERELRAQCLGFCSRHEILVGTADDSRKSTYTKGWSDFTIILPGRTLFIELKTATGKLSAEQLDFMEALRINFHFHYVVRSYPEFLNIMRNFLGRSLS